MADYFVKVLRNRRNISSLPLRDQFQIYPSPTVQIKECIKKKADETEIKNVYLQAHSMRKSAKFMNITQDTSLENKWENREEVLHSSSCKRLWPTGKKISIKKLSPLNVYIRMPSAMWSLVSKIYHIKLRSLSKLR